MEKPSLMVEAPQDTNLEGEKLEENEMEFSLKIVYSHFLSLFLFFFDGFLQLRDVLVLFLGFYLSLTTFKWINCYICFHLVYILISSRLALFLCLFTC